VRWSEVGEVVQAESTAAVSTSSVTAATRTAAPGRSIQKRPNMDFPVMFMALGRVDRKMRFRQCLPIRNRYFTAPLGKFGQPTSMHRMA
jgi:hypothetical protein